jgi:hypothetical protein
MYFVFSMWTSTLFSSSNRPASNSCVFLYDIGCISSHPTTADFHIYFNLRLLSKVVHEDLCGSGCIDPDILDFGTSLG